MTKAFAFESPQRAPQLLRLVSDDVRTELAVGPTLITLVAQLFWQVQNDRHRQNMKLASERDQRLARLRLHVRRVDYGQAASSQPLASDEVQDIECIIRGRLGILVVGHQAAAEV